MQTTAALDDAISKRRLTVIDMSNDRKVPDFGKVGHIGPSKLAERQDPQTNRGPVKVAAPRRSSAQGRSGCFGCSCSNLSDSRLDFGFGKRMVHRL